MATSCLGGFGRLLGSDSGAKHGKQRRESPTSAGNAGAALRGAERLLAELPEDSGGSRLREFWCAFAGVDLRSLLSGSAWTVRDLEQLRVALERCVEATRPFTLLSWSLVNSSSLDAVRSAEYIVGVPDQKRLTSGELPQAVQARRERLFAEASAFKLIAATLKRELGPESCKREVAQRCERRVQALLAASSLLPATWRSRP
eukprot:TRINITY_DN45667_c0_g1_i1.p1 TRINITY_DN45667_c0_g1~~TRINITY_DN45667_c0_g1_i1.p1  ORF type:complete len:218 (-),score=46.02 TRINITY_DN45667_c0_g1_i1:135-740(-)